MRLVVQVFDIRERLQEENHGRQEFNVEFLLVRDEVNQNVETTGFFEILQRPIIWRIMKILFLNKSRKEYLISLFWKLWKFEILLKEVKISYQAELIKSGVDFLLSSIHMTHSAE